MENRNCFLDATLSILTVRARLVIEDNYKGLTVSICTNISHAYQHLCHTTLTLLKRNNNKQTKQENKIMDIGITIWYTCTSMFFWCIFLVTIRPKCQKLNHPWCSASMVRKTHYFEFQCVSSLCSFSVQFFQPSTQPCKVVSPPHPFLENESFCLMFLAVSSKYMKFLYILYVGRISILSWTLLI